MKPSQRLMLVVAWCFSTSVFADWDMSLFRDFSDGWDSRNDGYPSGYGDRRGYGSRYGDGYDWGDGDFGEGFGLNFKGRGDTD